MKFGKWEVLGKGLKNKFLKCKCECGVIKELSERVLISKRNTQCRGCWKKSFDLTGQKFGKWTVLNIVPYSSSKSLRWFCKCECGAIKEVVAARLRSGNSLQCQKCAGKTKQKNKTINSRIFSDIKRSAKKRNIPFDITKEQIEQMFFDQNQRCALTNEPLVLIESRRYYDKVRSSIENTASLDRIDSSKGYTKDNIQWVTKHVNYMKKNIQQDKFIEICHLIAKNNPI